jgi:uncharacterized Zn finger protein
MYEPKHLIGLPSQLRSLERQPCPDCGERKTQSLIGLATSNPGVRCDNCGHEERL